MSKYRALPWSQPPKSERERNARNAWIDREFPLLREDSDSQESLGQDCQDVEQATRSTMSQMMSVGSLSVAGSDVNCEDLESQAVVDANQEENASSHVQDEDKHESQREPAIERSTPDPRFIGTVDSASLTVPDMDNIEPTLLSFPEHDPKFEKEEDAIAFANERAFRSRAVTAKYKALGKPTPWQEHIRMPDYWRLQDSRINPDSPPPALIEWRKREDRRRAKLGFLPPTPVKKRRLDL